MTKDQLFAELIEESRKKRNEGSYQRFMQRHTTKAYNKTMGLYERALDALVAASGDGRPMRQDSRKGLH